MKPYHPTPSSNQTTSRCAPWALVLATIAVLALGACVGLVGSDQGEHAGAGDFDTAEDALTVCPAGSTVEGIDVSYYQGQVDWNAVAGAGVQFGIARVSDSTAFVDPTFATNWNGMKQAGLVRGVYQFWRPSQDPIAQAELLLDGVAAAGGFESGDLPPVVDVETLEGYSASYVVQQLEVWIDHVEAATGRKPMIYTSAYIWSLLGSPTQFSEYPLWAAHWDTNCPYIPNQWSDWAMWQYSETGTVAGIGAAVDRNLFNGDLAALHAFASGGNTTPPPAEECGWSFPVGDPTDGSPFYNGHPVGGGNLPSYGVHLGADYWSGYGCTDYGQGVYAAAAGEVVEIADGLGSYLDVVVLRHQDPALGDLYSMYGHISREASLYEGKLVERRDSLGFIDDVTAYFSPCHLHFEILSAAAYLQGPFCSGCANVGYHVSPGYDQHKGVTQGVEASGDHYFEVTNDGIVGNRWYETDGFIGARQGTDCGGGSEGSLTSLGGTLDGEPSVAANDDGRVQVFARGADGGLWTVWDQGAGWSDWYGLGGDIVGRPEALLDGLGRIQVFALGSGGGVWRRGQVGPNQGFGSWVDMGGDVVGELTGVVNWSGRIELFGIGADGRMRHRYELSPGGSWSGWELRGSLAGGGLTHLDATRNAIDAPAVIGRAHDGQAYIIQLVSSGWTDWQALGGDPVGRVTLGENQDGRLEAFARSGAGELMHDWQSGTGWSGWWSLQGVVFDPVVTRTGDGRLVTFVRGASGDLWRIEQTAPNSGWGPWQSMGGSVSGAPAAYRDAGGQVHVFATSPAGQLWHGAL